MLLRSAGFTAQISALALAVGTACEPNLGYPTDDTAEADDTGAPDSEDPDDTSNPNDTSNPQDTSVPQDTGPQGDCHPADPVNTAGWTRNYAITYRGKTGTEVQRGQGGGTYTSQMTAQTDSWNVTVRNGCNAQGQALQQGWEGSASLQTSASGGFDLGSILCIIDPAQCAPTSEGYTVSATPSVPRPYLPSMADMRNGAQWSYTYNLAVVDTSGTNQFQPASVPTTGTYTSWGTSRIEPITIAGQTYDAFYLTNQYTQDWSTVGGSGGGMSNVDGYSELWYVEGLGLVKEKTTDLNDTSTIYVEKTLTSFTGLTPVQ